MTRQCGAPAAGQQREPVGQPFSDVRDGHGANPGRGEFDRQRQPVQALHDVGDGRQVSRNHRHARGGCTVEEQLRGRGRFERRQRPDVFAVDGQGFATGGDHPQHRGADQQPVDDVGGLVQQVLAVVHDDQGRAGAQGAGEQGPVVHGAAGGAQPFEDA